MPRPVPYTPTLRPAAEPPARRDAPAVAVSIEGGAFALSPRKNFYRIEEAAEIFSVSPRTVERWIDESRLDAVRPAYRRMVTHDSVMALLAEGWRRRFERTA